MDKKEGHEQEQESVRPSFFLPFRAVFRHVSKSPPDRRTANRGRAQRSRIVPIYTVMGGRLAIKELTANGTGKHKVAAKKKAKARI